MNVRKAAAVVVVALVAIGSLTGCRSSSKQGSAPTTSATVGNPAGSSPVAGGDSSTSTKGSSTAAKSVDVCALISAATAAQLSGQAFTTATREMVDDWSRCAYNDADSTLEGVNLSVTSQHVDTTWQAVHSVSNQTDISGIGDKALWDNDSSLFAVSGPFLIHIAGLDSEAKSEALAKALLAAL